MRKNNWFVVLVQVILLLIYVNGVFVFDFYMYDVLPRILNALTTFWIFPMVFAALMMYLGEWLTKAVPNHTVESTANLPVFYSTILWLAILAFNYAGIKDYFKLATLKNIHRTTLVAISNEDFSKLGFVSINEVQPMEAGKGLYQYTTTTKSGDSYTTTTHYYLTMPVIPLNDRYRTTTNCWLCEYDTKLPTLTLPSQGIPVQGLVIQDPYEVRKCKKAIKNAGKSYTAQTPLLLLEPIENFNQYYASSKKWAMWFFGIINFLFVGLPFYMTLKSSFTRNRN